MKNENNSTAKKENNKKTDRNIIQTKQKIGKKEKNINLIIKKKGEKKIIKETESKIIKTTYFKNIDPESEQYITVLTFRHGDVFLMDPN